MEVILRQDHPGLGTVGQKVTVKAGYARNFLLPRRIAVLATDGNLREVEMAKKASDKRSLRRLEAAQTFGEFLKHVELRIRRQSTDEERLYGSVTNIDLYDALQARPDVLRYQETAGIALDKRQILLEDPIKEIGNFRVPIKLHTSVTVEIVVHVDKE